MRGVDGPMAKLAAGVTRQVIKHADAGERSRAEICTEGGLDPGTITSVFVEGRHAPSLDVFARVCDGMGKDLMTVLSDKPWIELDYPHDRHATAFEPVRLVPAPPLSHAHKWISVAKNARGTVPIYGPHARQTLAVTADQDGEADAIGAPRGTVLLYRVDLTEPLRNDVVLLKAVGGTRTVLARWIAKTIVGTEVTYDLKPNAKSPKVSLLRAYDVLGTVIEVRKPIT